MRRNPQPSYNAVAAATASRAPPSGSLAASSVLASRAVSPWPSYGGGRGLVGKPSRHLCAPAERPDSSDCQPAFVPLAPSRSSSVQYRKTTILSCITVAKSPKYTLRTKHISIKYYHFRSFVSDGRIVINQLIPPSSWRRC